MADKPDAFVSLRSLKKPGAADPQQALEQIRRIYFKTTKQTIENDLAHAIELLKSLETEEQREKAAVFMEGIAQMRTEWAREAKRKSGGKPRGRTRT
jgi:hypothetical protein